MAVSDDNRGGTDRPVAQRPDGSWHLEDARKRREQREAAQTAPAPPPAGELEEDFSALALSLADNAMTTDGTPLSQLETRHERDASHALGLPAAHASTAEEIMRALEAEQHAAAPTTKNGAEHPRPGRSPHQPSSRHDPHRRRHAPRRRVIAYALGAAAAALLAVELTLGAGTTPREQPSRSAASRTAAPTAGLIAAATEKFVAVEHAADRNLSAARAASTRAPRPPRHRQTPVRPRTRRPTESRRSSTTTLSTGSTSEAVDTTQQVTPSSSSPSSTSTSSGSGQPPPASQSHTAPSTNSGSSSTSPSQATLRSLVTGAGTCGCQ